MPRHPFENLNAPSPPFLPQSSRFLDSRRTMKRMQGHAKGRSHRDGSADLHRALSAWIPFIPWPCRGQLVIAGDGGE